MKERTGGRRLFSYSVCLVSDIDNVEFERRLSPFQSAASSLKEMLRRVCRETTVVVLGHGC